MNIQQIRSSLLLLLTAVIWGVAFVAQSVGMDYVGPFTFTCVRSVIGGLALIPCIAFLNKKEAGQSSPKASAPQKPGQGRELFLGGLCCGLALGFASCFQQFGIQYTTVGKAGFITAFYIIIVPILGLFFRRKCGLQVWIGVILALAGLYFLCINETLRVGKGDLLVFICALLFAVHILVIDHFTQRVDGIRMSCIQFFVCGLLCAVGMVLFERPQLSQILAAWKPVLYAGFLSSGVGYTLQIVGQKGMNPTVASLILSLESVVSVLAGILLLDQTLSRREIIGCVLMFAAIILAQLPDKNIPVGRIKKQKE
ncbi:MAG: DMT family transporter [Lachnospiraceae bacterium]|jgi:drug/metabolite transporter (DMT)-like permease|nr:DMT family transporter [Lachnospiraceae bacterium]MCI8994502.1 DMT family transporter [Lachnospiraceae bacterium]MCI9133870.1 DMT family transporter [Lachnospiraceae bacterium]